MQGYSQLGIFIYLHMQGYSQLGIFIYLHMQGFSQLIKFNDDQKLFTYNQLSVIFVRVRMETKKR